MHLLLTQENAEAEAGSMKIRLSIHWAFTAAVDADVKPMDRFAVNDLDPSID